AAAKAGKGRAPEEERLAELTATLAELEGPLVRQLESDVEELGLEGAANAEQLPAIWLARNVFGW
ncbi:MAG: hypothetical protein P8R43_03620, partial [Planctomycetota bacterium]|nr:hypothetical protein [Planctomycetota bacterium]